MKRTYLQGRRVQFSESSSSSSSAPSSDSSSIKWIAGLAIIIFLAFILFIAYKVKNDAPSGVPGVEYGAEKKEIIYVDEYGNSYYLEENGDTMTVEN